MISVIYLEKVKLFQVTYLLLLAAPSITLNTVNPSEKIRGQKKRISGENLRIFISWILGKCTLRLYFWLNLRKGRVNYLYSSTSSFSEILLVPTI